MSGGAQGGGTGMDMPTRPFSYSHALDFHFDAVWLSFSLVALLLYGFAVYRLARRGDRWPVGRTIAWALGVLSVYAVTCTELNVYGMAMFSVHMVQHMMLSMLSPILLLLGAPMTLALRALPTARQRGRRGPREWLVRLLHSRYVRVISAPAFTLPIFIASLYGLYFTPLFDWTMSSRIGHLWMLTHFLAVGLLFFWPIMGVDPGPHRSGYVMRLLELFMGMPFHAFFGIAIMMSTQLLVTTFDNPPASMNVNPLGDQSAAGGIAWAFSEIPSVVVLLVLVRQWAKSEERLSRRKDRAAERDGDAELNAYNAYLARLHGTSSQTG